MSKRAISGFLPLSPVKFHILLALSDGTMHGYGVKREVESRTKGVVRLGAGTLYEAIQRLEQLGLIARANPPEDQTYASSRWRFYSTTRLGRDVLRAELSRLEADVQHARTKVALSSQHT